VRILYSIKPIKVLKMMKQNYKNRKHKPLENKKAQPRERDWALKEKVKITSRL
jgi:hypothetical protein